MTKRNTSLHDATSDDSSSQSDEDPDIKLEINRPEATSSHKYSPSDTGYLMNNSFNPAPFSLPTNNHLSVPKSTALKIETQSLSDRTATPPMSPGLNNVTF